MYFRPIYNCDMCDLLPCLTGWGSELVGVGDVYTVKSTVFSSNISFMLHGNLGRQPDSIFHVRCAYDGRSPRSPISVTKLVIC